MLILEGHVGVVYFLGLRVCICHGEQGVGSDFLETADNRGGQWLGDDTLVLDEICQRIGIVGF